MSDTPDRGSRRLAGGTARRGDRGPPDAPEIGRRPGTARARPGRPCRLPGDRRHTDAHARRAAATPLRAREPLEAVDRGRGATVRARGPRGRRAAATGLVAVGINSAVVNLPMKLASRRERPDREAAGVPDERHVPMPTSTSFPSGHSASAFAFAGAVAGSIPVLGAPLRGLATAVAYSRVHTGVHYPGDVIVGSVVGATIGEATAFAARCPAPSSPPDLAHDRSRVPAAAHGEARGSDVPSFHVGSMAARASSIES